MLTTGQSVSTHSEDKWSNLHRLMSPSPACLMGVPTIDVVWVLLFWPFGNQKKKKKQYAHYSAIICGFNLASMIVLLCMSVFL